MPSQIDDTFLAPNDSWRPRLSQTPEAILLAKAADMWSPNETFSAEALLRKAWLQLGLPSGLDSAIRMLGDKDHRTCAGYDAWGVLFGAWMRTFARRPIADTSQPLAVATTTAPPSPARIEDPPQDSLEPVVYYWLYAKRTSRLMHVFTRAGGRCLCRATRMEDRPSAETFGEPILLGEREAPHRCSGCHDSVQRLLKATAPPLDHPGYGWGKAASSTQRDHLFLPSGGESLCGRHTTFSPSFYSGREAGRPPARVPADRRAARLDGQCALCFTRLRDGKFPPPKSE